MTAIDGEGRCTHWHGRDDVLWLEMACCDEWWPCRACHDESVDHEAQTWRVEEATSMMRCGRCLHVFGLREYMPTGCPRCGKPFNPGCRQHLHLYVQP